MVALLLEELSFRGYGTVSEQPLLVVWALLESLGYRQLTVWWRVRGIVGWLRGRTHWGVMERQGFPRQPDGEPNEDEPDLGTKIGAARRSVRLENVP